MIHQPREVAPRLTPSLLRFLASLFLVFQSYSVISQSSVDTRFLNASGNADGSIALQSDVSWPYQSTAEAIITYRALNQSDSQVAANGRAYLESISVNSTENLSLRLLSSAPNSPVLNATLADINRRQNDDGGVGAFDGFGSDLLSTTYALRVLAHAGVANDVSGRAVAYLLSKQNAEGSWSFQDNPNRIETTALVVDALWLFRKQYLLSGALTDGITYLTSQRSAGLWGETEASALALSAILNVEVDRSDYQTSFTHFSNLQRGNGSFEDDVYLTALGLRVLDAIEKPAPDEITLSGRVVDGDSGTVLAGAAIQLTGASSVLLVADGDGEFAFANLPAGSYSLSVTSDGFGELTLNTLLTLGAKANLGDLQLSRLQIDPDTGDPVTTGIVRGTITDRRTGAPLPNVVVTVLGADLSATTNQAGQYQLGAVPSGVVQLNATATGYGSAVGSANLAAGQTLIFSPTLQEQVPVGVALQGNITDRLSGALLAGVQLLITGGDSQSQSVITDANGAYSVEGIVAGQISIQATLADYHPVSVATNVEDGARLEFSPQMDLLSQDSELSLGGLSGGVTDSVTGQGLADVQLTLTYSSTGDVFTQTSGPNGKFTLVSLPAEQATFLLELPGYTTLSAVVDVQAGLTLDVGTIELMPEGERPISVSGFVVDVRNRQPINGAAISARNTTTNQLVEGLSDTNGQFTLTTVVPGEYEITASSTGYISQTFAVVLEAADQLNLGDIRLRQEGVNALLADLVITDIDTTQVESDQSTFTVDGSITGMVINQGNAAVQTSFEVVAFEDTDRDGVYSSADINLGSSLIEVDSELGFAVDNTVTFSIVLEGKQFFHDAPINLFVDANNIVAEIEESNNYLSTAGLCSGGAGIIDLGFCLDSSGSIGIFGYRTELNGLADAVLDETIIPRNNQYRLSVATAGPGPRFFEILTPTLISQANFETVSDQLRIAPYYGGGTDFMSYCVKRMTDEINDQPETSSFIALTVAGDGVWPNDSGQYFPTSVAELAGAESRQYAVDRGVSIIDAIGVRTRSLSVLESHVYPQPAGGDSGKVTVISNIQEFTDAVTSVIQEQSDIPDLTVGGLSLIDNGGGNNASASLVIGNGGSGDISGAIVVRLYNGLPEQGAELLVEQTYSAGLLSGERAQIAIENIVPTALNSGELLVEVVLADGSTECNQDNNRQQIIVTSLLGDIALSLNGNVFGSNTDINLASLIANTGSLEGNYTVSLTILDAGFALVADVATFDVTSVPPSESQSFNHLWNTGTAISGNYIARATLADANGNLLDTADASFTISDLINPDGTPNGVPAAALRAATDRPFYHVDDQVQLDALAENITAIHPIANPQLLMVVTDASGTPVLSETAALSSLAPGQIAQAMRALNLVQASVGVYQYSVTLLGNGGATFATAAASFEVINDLNAAVRGNVAAQLSELFQGETQTCTLTTSNTGTQDLSSLAVNYRVLNVDAQENILVDGAAISLNAGASTNQLQSFSTRGFAPGNYACTLEVTLDGEQRVLANDQFTVLEAPINIASDLRVSSSSRLLVLVDPLQDTCTANRSITLEGEFDQLISEDTGVYAKVYGRYRRPKDYEVASPRDFGDIVTDEINHHHGQPDIAITSLSTERIQIRLSSAEALLGRYRIAHFTTDSGWRSTLESGHINFTCGTPIVEGQTLGALTVVATDTVELLAASQRKYREDDDDDDNKRHHYTRYTQAEVPALETQYGVLEALLSGRAYTLVDNVQDFKKALLSGQYQQYLLLSERQSLDHVTAKMLRESVNRGEGLIVAGGRAPNAEPLWETLRIASSRQHRYGDWDDDDDEDRHHHKSGQLRAEGLRLLETPLAPAEDLYFNLERLLPRIDQGRATLAGVMLNPELAHPMVKRYRDDDDDDWDDDDWDDDDRHKRPSRKALQEEAIVTYTDYGQGKAIFIGYDLLAEAAYLGGSGFNQHTQLLMSSLNFTTPLNQEFRVGGVVPVELLLENLGSETPVTAVIQWPPGSHILASVPAANDESGISEWTVDLFTDETARLTSWAVPEYTDGRANVIADIYIGADTTQAPYQRHALELHAVQLATLATIKQDLALLKDTATQRRDRKQLKRAFHWLKKAQHFYNKNKRDKALNMLLYTTNYLKEVDGANVVALRLQVDHLIWQWARQESDRRVQP